MAAKKCAIIRFPLMARITREIAENSVNEMEAIDRQLGLLDNTLKTLNEKRQVLLILYRRSLRRLKSSHRDQPRSPRDTG